MVSSSHDPMMSRPRDSAVSRPRTPLFIGISILGIAAVITALATTRSHTVQGKLTAANAAGASVACDQIKVKAELWINTATKTGPMPQVGLGSTTAQGTTLGNGCSYTLTFNDIPFPPLPVASMYRVSAERPMTIEEGPGSAGYAHSMSHPFPEEYNMSL